MIDYEKLKQAHELAFKLSQQSGMRVDVTVVYVDSDSPDYFLMDYTSDYVDLFTTVEDLIAELTELTQPKQKYQFGDEVWVCRGYWTDYQPEILTIQHKCCAGYTLTDDESIFVIPEDYIYPTKEALIEAQVAHWISLKTDECQHEPNGQTSLIGYPEAYKCKKCGVYYR